MEEPAQVKTTLVDPISIYKSTESNDIAKDALIDAWLLFYLILE